MTALQARGAFDHQMVLCKDGVHTFKGVALHGFVALWVEHQHAKMMAAASCHAVPNKFVQQTMTVTNGIVDRHAALPAAIRHHMGSARSWSKSSMQQ